MTKKEKILKTKNYYINIDYKILNNYLTKQQMALIVLIYKLNRANLTATNKEIASFLGTTAKGTNIKSMIDNINSKTNGLIEVKYDTTVNHLGKIMTKDKEIYSKARSLHLTRALFTKGQRYINIPSFVYENKEYFLSSNELRVLGHAKSMKNGTFKGFMRVFAHGAKLSLGIIKRSLRKLVLLKAIRKKWISVHHKIKNIFYSVNIISTNLDWQPTKNHIPETIKKNIHKSSKSDEEDWAKITAVIGDL